MNPYTLITTTAATMLLFAAQPLHAAAPKIDALKAAKIATDYLAKQGPGAPHIISIIAETTSLTAPQSWAVRWSSPIEQGGSKEVGLRVKFDGTTVRLVEGRGGGRKKQGASPGFYQ